MTTPNIRGVKTLTAPLTITDLAPWASLSSELTLCVRFLKQDSLTFSSLLSKLSIEFFLLCRVLFLRYNKYSMQTEEFYFRVQKQSFLDCFLVSNIVLKLPPEVESGIWIE